MKQKKEFDYFDKPENIKKLWIMLYAICGLLIIPLREELEELKKSMRALTKENIAEDTRMEEPHTPVDPQPEDYEAPSIEDQPPEGDEAPHEEPPL